MAGNQSRHESGAQNRHTNQELSPVTPRERAIFLAFLLLFLFSCGVGIYLFSENQDDEDMQATLDAFIATTTSMSDEEVYVATKQALQAVESLTPTPTPSSTPSPSPTLSPSATNEFVDSQYALENDQDIPQNASDVDIYFETLGIEHGEIESVEQVFEITRADINILKKMMTAYGINETTLRSLLPNIDSLAPFANIQELIAESDYLHRQLSPISLRGVDVDPANPETSGLNMTIQDLEILSSDDRVDAFTDLWTPESWESASNLRIEQGSSPTETTLVPVDGLLSRALADQDLGLGVVSEDNEHKYIFAVPQVQNLWPTLKLSAIDFLADETNGQIDINKLHEASDIFANLVTNHLLGTGQGSPINIVFNEPQLNQQFISTMRPHPFIDVREYYDGPAENNGQQSPFGDPVDQDTRLRCVVVDENIVDRDADPTELSWWINESPSNTVTTISISLPANENLSNPEWLAQASASEIAHEMFNTSVILAGQASAEYQDSPDREADLSPDPSVNRGITFIEHGCQVAPTIQQPTAVPEQPVQGEQPPGPEQPPESPSSTPEFPATATEKAPEGQDPTAVPTDITGDQPTPEPTKILPTPQATPPQF